MREKNWVIFIENMSLSICVFDTYAKEKHKKNENKFDKILFLYIISTLGTKMHGNVAQ